MNKCYHGNTTPCSQSILRTICKLLLPFIAPVEQSPLLSLEQDPGGVVLRADATGTGMSSGPLGRDRIPLGGEGGGAATSKAGFSDILSHSPSAQCSYVTNLPASQLDSQMCLISCLHCIIHGQMGNE